MLNVSKHLQSKGVIANFIIISNERSSRASQSASPRSRPSSGPEFLKGDFKNRIPGPETRPQAVQRQDLQRHRIHQSGQSTHNFLKHIHTQFL